MLVVELSPVAPKLYDPARLTIGIVNNMPDGALHDTEQQFSELLAAASQNCTVTIRFFSLPGVPRAADAQSYVSRHYQDLTHLSSIQVDGLIVTGTEPRTDSLLKEAYWPALRELIEFADGQGIPAVWSCLAAHAAVLHLNGVERRRFTVKLSGVFECSMVADHPMVAGAPSAWYMPHSRQNDLPEDALISNGYRILSRAPEIGADMFIREGNCLFVFLQGHPEYDPGALLREYRRDVRRFLIGERENYPAMPQGYFDQPAREAFAAYQARAIKERRSELITEFPQVSSFTRGWREQAVVLYKNWFSYLANRKTGSCQRTTRD
jgi:homoserine O-succinyltransferase/O-acetyltransferase